MNEYLPLLIIGAAIGLSAAVLIFIYGISRRKPAPEDEELRHEMKTGTILKRILPYAKPYWKWYLGIFAIIIVSIAYDLISPILIGDMEDLVKNGFEMEELLKLLAAFFSILLVSAVAMYFQAVLLQKVGQRILSSIREELFRHIESLSHNQFNHIPVGKLVTRETNDTNSLSRLFTEIITSFAKSAVMIFGLIGAMFLVNLELTLLVLCFLPLIVLISFLFQHFMRKAFRRTKNATTDMNTFLSENLSGMKIIQIFNNEEKKQKEFEKKNQNILKAHDGEVLVFASFRPLVYLLYIASVMYLFYIGGKSSIENQTFLGMTITSGTVVTFYFYLMTLFDPIQRLAEVFNRLQSAVASAEKILTVFDMKPEIVDSEDAIEIEELRGEIEFRNVWFAYKEGDWILKDVSFHILPKETVAFVGATGAGKTTILSLLTRNYDIQKGQILIDGMDVKKIRLSSLRKCFGEMLQDVFLFSGTLRSNLTLREEGFTDEDVLSACRYVNADSFIQKLPEGLLSEVRERGSNFSQGQRQLLSFARTVLHRPNVMILDEATANIDTETEKLIQDSLQKMRNIGTMLIVAHRLSTIQNADRIIVLSHGEIKETGNHFELLHKRGMYYDLYKLQYEEK